MPRQMSWGCYFWQIRRKYLPYSRQKYSFPPYTCIFRNTFGFGIVVLGLAAGALVLHI